MRAGTARREVDHVAAVVPAAAELVDQEGRVVGLFEVSEVLLAVGCALPVDTYNLDRDRSLELVACNCVSSALYPASISLPVKKQLSPEYRTTPLLPQPPTTPSPPCRGAACLVARWQSAVRLSRPAR